MEKKSVIGLLVFLIFISSISISYAQTTTISKSTPSNFPTIIIPFDEQVNVTGYEFFDSRGVPMGIDRISNDGNDTQIFKQNIHLTTGEKYYLYINISDMAGNPSNDTIEIIINIENFRAWLDQPGPGPTTGASTSSPFPIVVASNMNGTCKYALSSKIYDDMTPLDYSGEGSCAGADVCYFHTKESFSASADTNYPIYVKCKAANATLIVSYTFNVMYVRDTPVADVKFTAPSITLQSGIYKSTERGDTSLVSTISNNKILSNNQRSICKYGTSPSDTYLTMKLFPLEDVNNDSTYKIIHTLPLIDKDRVEEGESYDIENGKIYDYYVVCRNLAGSISDIKKITLDVQYDTTPVITINVPKNGGFYGAQILKFNVTTNQRTTCTYANSSEGTPKQLGLATAAHDHLSGDVKVQPGANTFYISCLFQEGEVPQITTFTVDLTPPRITSIITENYSAYTDRLSATFDGIDEESGIDGFIYRIESSTTPGKLITNWTITKDKSADARDLNLTNLAKYIFRVKAINKAGLMSSENVSSPITIDSSKETDPPIVNLTKTKAADGARVTVKCADPHGCRFLYAQNKNLTVCSPTNNFNLDQNATILFTSTQYICWRASDSLGNFKIGSELISVDIATCNDKIKNQDEVDIDCGGKCPPCLIGKKCAKSSDCFSSWCNETVCSQPSCEDGIKNGAETDVDCGGNCALCLEGKECIENSDCGSNTCGEDKKCGGASCEDGIKNGNETDVDCGGICAKKCGLESACSSDNDCISNDKNCAVGFCMESSCNDCNKRDENNNGVPDWYEQKFAIPPGFNISKDLDTKGMSVFEQWRYYERTGKLLDPRVSDTDHDGWEDRKEIDMETDPADALNFPKSNFWLWILLIVLIIVFLFGGYYGYMLYSSRKQGFEEGSKIGKGQQAMTQAKVESGRIMTVDEQKKKIEIEETIKKRRAERIEKRTKQFESFEAQKLRKPISEVEKVIKEVMVNKEKTAEKKPAFIKKIVQEFKPEIVRREKEEKPLKKQPDEFDKLSKIVNETSDFEKLERLQKPSAEKEAVSIFEKIVREEKPKQKEKAKADEIIPGSFVKEEDAFSKLDKYVGQTPKEEDVFDRLDTDAREAEKKKIKSNR